MSSKSFSERVQLLFTQCYIDIGLEVTKSAPPGGAAVNCNFNLIYLESM